MDKFIMNLKETPTIKSITDNHVKEFKKRNDDSEYKDQWFMLGEELALLVDEKMKSTLNFGYGISTFVVCLIAHTTNEIEQVIQNFNSNCTVQNIFDYIILTDDNTGIQIVSLYVGRAYATQEDPDDSNTVKDTKKHYTEFEKTFGRNIVAQNKLSFTIVQANSEYIKKRPGLKIVNF